MTRRSGRSARANGSRDFLCHPPREIDNVLIVVLEEDATYGRVDRVTGTTSESGRSGLLQRTKQIGIGHRINGPLCRGVEIVVGLRDRPFA